MTAKDSDHYVISARLVHILIGAITSSLLGIAAYMVIWANADAAHKATLDNRINYMSLDIMRLENRIETGLAERPPEWLRNQVNNNTLAIRELERSGVP